MKRENLGSLSRLALVAGTLIVGTAHAGNFPDQGTADAPSTEVVTQGVLQYYANQLTNIIESRVRLGASPCRAPFSGFAAWGGAEYDHLKNNLSSTSYNGHISSAFAGFDTALSDYAVLGVAFNYETQNIDTGFNFGKQTADGWAIMPYLSFMITPDFSLTLLAGYEWLDYDLTRVEPFTARHIYSEPDSDRYFGAIELTYQHYFCNWDLGAQAAVLYLNETTGGFDEFGTNPLLFYPKNQYYLGRFKLGGTAGYVFWETLEPYVRAAFLWDYAQTDINASPIQAQPSNSNTAGLFALGVNVFSSDNVLFNLDAYTEQFRDDFDHWGVIGTFRVLL